MKSPKLAPEYTLYRTVTTPDVVPIVEKEHGINMRGFRFANVQVVPDAADTPEVQVLFWSDVADKFIRSEPDLSPPAGIAGEAYEFVVECTGRIMFLSVTGAAADTELFVSGFNERND